jgi:diketogulonate reductase-like aldo/keto reductase
MRFVTARDIQVPALGLGTYCLNGEAALRMVSYALDIGYRHIDTAQEYRNEAEIGEAISASSVPRQDIWLTTKVWLDRFRDGDLQRSVEESVRRLRTEPDLLLLHWPNPRVSLRQTIRALSDVKRRRLTKHIGVSNFTVALIRKALALSQEPLLVNQVEYHPYLSQRAVLEALRANGMALIAYSPLALGRVFRDATLQGIGERYGKNAGQVALRWLLQQDGVSAIPRSSREANLKANLAVFDFQLTASDMAKISALANPHGRLVDPVGLAPAWDDLSATERARRNAGRVAQAVRARVGRVLRVALRS